MKQELYGLQVDYDNGHGHFMVLSACGGLTEKELSALQLKMLTLHRIPKLLPFQVQAKEGQLQLYYEITGRKMLSQWLRQETLTLAQFFTILHQIAEALDDSKTYMLQPGRYILKEDYMFCGAGLEDLHFTYVPKEQLENKGSVPSDLQHLASRLVHKVDELRGSGFQELMSYLQEESFTIAEWKRLLQKHMALSDSLVTTASTPKRASTESPSRHNSTAASSVAKPREESVIFDFPNVASSGMASAIPAAMPMESLQTGGESAALWKKQLLVAVMFALSCVLIWQFYAEHESEVMLYICAGVTLLFAGAAYMLYTKVTKTGSKESIDELPYADHTHEDRNDSFFREVGLPYEPITAEPASARIPQSVSPGPLSAPHTVLLPSPEATVLLSPNVVIQEGAVVPSLEYRKEGMAERIPLRKHHFVIGRTGAEVDWVSEDAGVSRIHAEICREDKQYAVKDLGSRNGTMLNGVALVPYRMYPLKDGDIIKIIRTEFTFKMGS